MVICDPVFRLSDLLAFGDQKVTAQPFFFLKAYKRDVYLDKSQVGEGGAFLGDHLAFGSWGWSQGLCFSFFLSSQKFVKPVISFLLPRFVCFLSVC